jgi:N-acetylmuramoyl-L-alanine amidase
MFIFKKSLIIGLACIILAGCILGISATVAANNTVNVAANTLTIVVDAGHGGIDAGVLGIKTNTKESNINLAISKYLKGYFVNAGFNCVLTRTSYGGLYETTSKGFKMRDMLKRKQIIQDNNADMVISIHQNYCPLSSRRGSHVFYDESSSSGKLLAQSIQNSLNSMKESVTTNSPLIGDYFMLKCTDNPSVIVECGFLSNAEDEKLLIDTSYQKALAYAIFKGAVSFYS